MEDLNAAHWVLLPFGPFAIIILFAIPGVIIALLWAIIIKLIKMARKRYNND